MSKGSQTRPWFCYLVKCADGTLYAGIAPDLRKRLARHNRGKGAKYTRGRLPVTLVYAETHPDRASALRREAAIKKMTRARKEALIAAGSAPGRTADQRGNPG